VSPGAGPSPDDLRRAASALENVATDASQTASKIAATAAGLRGLPGRIADAIAGTTTHVDQQVVGQLTRAGSQIAVAESSLRATATQAGRSAQAARAQADRIEQEQAQQGRALSNRSTQR
jgi:hypothetical protein